MVHFALSVSRIYHFNSLKYWISLYILKYCPVPLLSPMSEVARLWCDDVVMFYLTVVEYVVYMCNKPLDLVLDILSLLLL